MQQEARNTRNSLTRREALLSIAAAGAATGLALPDSRADVSDSSTPSPDKRVPVIDVTDLYHPPQDLGDNLDLISAYALPEIDLKAVILDCTDRYRRPYRNPDNPSFDDPAGGRDPGFIPVLQLNHLFGRDIPCGAAPFAPMKDPEDCMPDAPGFQQSGVDLILRTLRESTQPVDIVSFGSARPVALAFNRAPDLLRERVGRIHLCAGASPPGFLEWNVQLDVHAFVRVLSCGLPVAIYPCGAETSAWDLGRNNTYWQLPDRSFIRRMHPRLQSYLAFALDRSARMDFLCAVEEPASEVVLSRVCGGPHHVWETAVWAQVAGRRVVRKPGESWRLRPGSEIDGTEEVIVEGLEPGRIRVQPDGQFDFEGGAGARTWRYFREDPKRCQAALCEAFPSMYESFTLPEAVARPGS